MGHAACACLLFMVPERGHVWHLAYWKPREHEDELKMT